jgi:DNA-binding NarL/FixJ family response regulator
VTLRVVVADDQELVREGFRLILEAAGIDVVGEARDGREAVALARRLTPDVVLMDIRMPVLDGLAATRELTALDAERRPAVLVLTTFDLDEYVLAALRAGASGFLLKDAGREQLVAAIRTVAAGQALVDPAVTRVLVERYLEAAPREAPPALAELTAREREVLVLLGRGASNAEIASALVISEATARTHVARILAKLDLRDRVQAVVFGYDHGIVAPGRIS